MRSLLIRCYPARWRARYGEEFLVILEERPLGPYDVADILLGALDARLRSRGDGAASQRWWGLSMSLRIGGIAAIIGAPLWTAGFMMANNAFGNIELRIAAAALVIGSLTLLVALAGLTAFQARVQPVLSWAACALPAVGMIGSIVGASSVALGGDIGDAFFFGILAFFVGSSLFAIATYITAVLSRPAAVLLGIAPIVAFLGGDGGGTGEILIVVALVCFTLGWFALGVQAIRLDRPSSGLRAA